MTNEQKRPRITVTALFNPKSNPQLKANPLIEGELPATFSVTAPIDGIARLVSVQEGTLILTNNGEYLAVQEKKAEIIKKIAAAKKL